MHQSKNRLVFRSQGDDEGDEQINEDENTDDESEEDDGEIGGEEWEEHHNQGQEDASNDVWDPPKASIIFNASKDYERQRAYRQGWYHTQGQLHFQEGIYEPPSDTEDAEAYEEGYEAAKSE